MFLILCITAVMENEKMKIKEYIIRQDEDGNFLHIDDELIRCKDCQYYKPFSWVNAVRGWCYNHWRSEGFGFEVREIDFCSYGERKCDDDVI